MAHPSSMHPIARLRVRARAVAFGRRPSLGVGVGAALPQEPWAREGHFHAARRTTAKRH